MEWTLLFNESLLAPADRDILKREFARQAFASSTTDIETSGTCDELNLPILGLAGYVSPPPRPLTRNVFPPGKVGSWRKRTIENALD